MICYLCAHDHKAIRGKLIALYALNVSDALLTFLLIRTGCFREANFLLKGVVLNFGEMFLVKIVFPAVLIAWLYFRIHSATEKQLKEDIEFVASRGLFSGTSATTFSPNTAMTRGMFVTALGRLANADVSSYTKSSFTDVKSDAYYMGYIEWASKNDIVNGVGNNRFAPDQSITREQMAVISLNYAKAIGFTLPKVHSENTFADSAKVSAYAKDAVKQMQMAGVICGKNGNLFDPQGTATRAEVSAVLRRFVELAISSDTMQGWTRNDSGQWMYYKNGKPVTGKTEIDGSTYLDGMLGCCYCVGFQPVQI